MHARCATLSLGSFVLLVLLTLPRWVSADAGLDFVGGVGFGVTELEFDEKLDTDPSFNTYQLFGSVVYEKVYASVTWADSFSDANVSEEDETGEASRQDLDLTLGYRLTDAWTVFLGYKDGETELDFRVRDSDIRQSESYAEDGLYAGVTYSLNLPRVAGTLNFSLAYIRFDSDLKFTEGVDEGDDEEDGDEPLEFDDLEGRASGDADGFSAGLSWVIPVSDNLAFRSELKVNQYDLEVKSAGMRFEPDQRLTYFNVGLLYAF